MTTIIAPDYNFDVTGAQRLEADLNAVDEGDIVIDLSGVSFVASSGLRVLLKASQRLDRAGGKLSVVHTSDLVMEVFTMSGFDSFIDVS